MTMLNLELSLIQNFNSTRTKNRNSFFCKLLKNIYRHDFSKCNRDNLVDISIIVKCRTEQYASEGINSDYE